MSGTDVSGDMSVMSTLDKFSISGRSALVTGANSGIGLAFVEMLVEAGASVTLVGWDLKKVTREADRLADQGYSVLACQADVSDEDQVRKAFDAHVEAFNKLDIVFANAGISGGRGYIDATGARIPEGQINEADLQHWNNIMATDLSGVYYTLRHAARIMKAFKRNGSIIVTTSNASTITVPVVAAPYMAAKAGAAHLVRQIARELAEFGIRVNAIAPGAFITNIGGGKLSDPAVQEAWGKTIPLGRKVATTEQIKPLALYLASDASDYVTGTEIVIDGGVSLDGF